MIQAAVQVNDQKLQVLSDLLVQCGQGTDGECLSSLSNECEMMVKKQCTTIILLTKKRRIVSGPIGSSTPRRDANKLGMEVSEKESETCRLQQQNPEERNNVNAGQLYCPRVDWHSPLKREINVGVSIQGVQICKPASHVVSNMLHPTWSWPYTPNRW